VTVTRSAPIPHGKPLVRAIHRAVPGRARFAVAGLYRDAALARALEGQLRHRSGIYSASANSLTGKVLVLFDPGLDLEEIEARI
jgi:Ca2+-transporting ATPase